MQVGGLGSPDNQADPLHEPMHLARPSFWASGQGKVEDQKTVSQVPLPSALKHQQSSEHPQ
jgi:hypothetical protein